MLYSHNITAAVENLKPKEQTHFHQLCQQLGAAQETITEKQHHFLSDRFLNQPLDQLLEVASHIRTRFSKLVVFGTGGSSLGGKTLLSLAQANHFPVEFIENTDPHTLEQLFTNINYANTAFLVISKSGGTIEPMIQCLLLISHLKRELGEAAIKDHVFAITEAKENPLRTLATKLELTTLDHDADIGGRFSVFSNVGLLPAAVAGLDINALRQGALHTTRLLSDPQSAPALGAALMVANMQTRPVNIIMPYCDRLWNYAAWAKQLWAESLGKDGKGTTMVRALGTVDQHSQLQLYLDGPKDKIFTLINVKYGNKATDQSIHSLGIEGLSYLQGHTATAAFSALQEGMVSTMVEHGCPVRVIETKELDETIMGALLMHMMLETVIAAELIEVDAFDQPAVEGGKALTRKYLKDYHDQS